HPVVCFIVKNDGLTNVRMVSECSLNLGQFHAEAADLYLTIAATEKLDVAVFQVAPNVAGSEQPRAWPVAERIGDEFLGRQRGMVEIPTREAGATNTEFTRRADGCRLQMFV